MGDGLRGPLPLPAEESQHTSTLHPERGAWCTQLHRLCSYPRAKPQSLCGRSAICFTGNRIPPSDLIALNLCWHKISAGSHVIPSEHLCLAFVTGPRTKLFFLKFGDNVPWGIRRAGRERWTQEDAVPLSGWCEDGAAQTGAPHFCGQCSGFCCPWEGEGGFNTPSTHRGHLPVSL